MVEHGSEKGKKRREGERQTEGDEGEQGTIWVSASNAGTDAERRRGSVTWRRNCYGIAVP